MFAQAVNLPLAKLTAEWRAYSRQMRHCYLEGWIVIAQTDLVMADGYPESEPKHLEGEESSSRSGYQGDEN